MNLLELQMAIMSAAAGAVEFAFNWFIQSTLLILAGLLLARFLRRQDAAAKSLIYRTTLAAVLICPFATWGLAQIGVSGWSLAIGPAYTYEQISTVPSSENVEGFAALVSENSSAVTGSVDADTALGVDGSDSFEVSPLGPNALETANGPAPASIGDAEILAQDLTPATSFTVANELWQLDVSWLGLLSPFIVLGWIAMSGYLIARLTTSWWVMSSLLRGAHVADESTTELCHQLANDLAVPAPAVVCSPFIPSPCLAGIGFLKPPSILLPNDDSNLPMRDVLVHELAHLRRRDCHWNLIRQIATAVYFFQPLLWVLSRRIEVTAEEVCDDIVVSAGGDRHDYAHRLVDIAELSADVSAAAVAAAGVGIVSLRSLLAQRVERILDTSRSLSTRVGHSLMVAVLVGGVTGTVIVGLVGLNQPTVAAVEEPTKEQDADNINNLEFRVVLPNGAVAAKAHVAITGYDPEHGKMLIFAESMTNSEGICQVDANALPQHPSPDNVRFVLARRDGYGIGWTLLGGPQPRNPAGRAIVEVKLHEQGIVKGRLIDIEGQPAAGESLQIGMVMDPAIDPPGFTSMVGFRSEPGAKRPLAWLPSVTSDDAGRFELTGVPKDYGLYMSVVNSKNFAPQDIALNTGQPEQRGERDATYRSLVKNFKPGEEAVLALSPAKVFTGTITYEDSDEPVPGAKVSIWASQQKFGSMTSVEGFTDEEGRYRILPNPGIRFGVTAYPPSGVPYMARKTERLTWENSELIREVDIQIPRVVLVRGRVLEEGSDKPVEGATITFESGEKASDRPENVVTGWQAKQTSDADGRFTFAVPPGRGTLLIKKKGGNYILQHEQSRQLRSGKPGGSRVYAHALHEINTGKGDDAVDVEIRVIPGHQVSGEIVDEQGKPVKEAFVVTNLRVWDYSGEWRGDSRPNLGGKFELNGLSEDKEHPVFFLDPHRKLGATVNLRAKDENVKVVLKPCGTARAKFVLDSEDRKFSPTLYFVVTPGISKYDFEGNKDGTTSADEDFNANIDRINYGRLQLQKDADGSYTFPALIPGATYRLLTQEESRWSYKDFTVRSGETLDLGEFTPTFDD